MTKRASRLLISSVMSWAVMVPSLAVAVDPPTTNVHRQPVDVVFVLDNSGSMRENDPDFLTRAAVANFATVLAENRKIDGRVAIVLFDEKARLIRGLTAIGAGQTKALLDALAELDFSGQRTNSPAGIERALYELRQNGRKEAYRAIVFLTDGQIDTGSTQRDLEAARWLREDLARESAEFGIQIFGVAFTEAADYQLLQAVARRTSASYYRAFEASELASVVDDVVSKLTERDFHEFPPGTPTAPSPPDVAAAPLPDNGQAEFELFGLLPVAILLVGGSLLWRNRARAKPATSPSLAHPVEEPSTPTAQILDLDGHLGRAGAAIELAHGRTRIGRDSHNDIVFADDTISSEHAIIEVRDGRYWLEDQKSTNGTRLGGQRLEPSQPVQLKGGDHIQLAEVDLMFVLRGYVPGGQTIFSSAGTSPPADWRAAADSALATPFDLPTSPSEDVAKNAWASEERAERIDLHTPLDKSAERDEQLSLLRTPATNPKPVAEGSEAYRRGLDYHLERVSEISPAFASFIDRAFNEEIRDAISVSALELVPAAEVSSRIVQKTYTSDRIRFVLCGAPGTMESARQFYVDAFGGFTRMLTELLQAESFRAERCEILAVLTFGRGNTPWVSLSVVPDDDQDPRIDLLSYEFLTEEERREIEPGEQADVSRSGLG